MLNAFFFYILANNIEDRLLIFYEDHNLIMFGLYSRCFLFYLDNFFGFYLANFMLLR
jgi:hypothetical protein